MLSFVFVLSVLAYLTQAQNLADLQPELEPCGECDSRRCPPTTQCNVGTVRDRCDCCEICGLEEHHLCNLETEVPYLAKGGKGLNWHGRCGTDLECRTRNDVNSTFVGTQNICYCLKPGRVCGSDGKTYSKCQIRAAITSSLGEIQETSEGPCKSAPKITMITPSQVVRGEPKVTLICEAHGYPVPTVTWLFSKRKNDPSTRQMPSDSGDITFSVRGGPDETGTTSYLQITNFKLEYEGQYKCVAENVLGVDVRDASLVMDTNGLWRNDEI